MSFPIIIFFGSNPENNELLCNLINERDSLSKNENCRQLLYKTLQILWNTNFELSCFCTYNEIQSGSKQHLTVL